MTQIPARGPFRVKCTYCGWVGVSEEHATDCPRYPNKPKGDQSERADTDYNARVDRACTILSGDDWNARFLQALDREGLMLVMKWDLSKTDNRYPWPGTPIPAPLPFGEDGPTWPRGSYIVFKP